MALFRNESRVEVIEHACPICHSDVKGNDVYMYFCEKCNILFRKDDLVLTKDTINELLKEKVAEKFSKESDKLRLSQDTIAEKELSERKKDVLKDLKESKKYFLSKKSNTIHVSNCPYGKNIKKENRITLKSLEGTGKYKKCKCMID